MKIHGYIKTFIISMSVIFPTQYASAQQVHTETWEDGIERSLVYRPGD